MGECGHIMCMHHCNVSLKPRLSVLDFASQLWRRIFSKDEKPGFQANKTEVC